MSAIFYHNDVQRQLALETKALEENQRNRKIQTEITSFGKFYLAEDYHQKFNLRQRKEFFREYQEIYPELENFVNSTAVSRLNGYVSGHGSFEQLQEELKTLGLSEEAQKTLIRIVKTSGR